MALLSSARSTGVIGSILTLFVLSPGAGTVLAVIGWILIIYAVHQIADITGDRKILNDVLIAALLSIIGLAVFSVVLVGHLLSFLSANGVGLTLARGDGSLFATGGPRDLGGLIVGVVEGLAVLWVFLLASAVFLRKGYERIAVKLNVKMFATAALIYLIGAALTIVAVGLLVIFVASVLQGLAFFRLPDDVPGTTPKPVPMTVPPPPS